MLGLSGFVLLAVSSAFGELEQAVETTAAKAWCEGWLRVAAQPHGRRLVRVRDLPSSGRPVALQWLKRLGLSSTGSDGHSELPLSGVLGRGGAAV